MISENKTKKSLVIIISGIDGGRNTSIVKNFSDFIQVKTDFEILSLNFKKTDSLKNYSHIIDEKINFHDEVYLIGHSFGALVVAEFYFLFKNKYQVNKIIFWDPSDCDQILKVIKNHSVLNSKKNTIEIMDKNSTARISFSTEILMELSNFNICKKLSGLNKILIIGAENGAVENAINYNKIFKKSEILIIKNTGHMFGDYRGRKQLYNKSVDYLLNN